MPRELDPTPEIAFGHELRRLREHEGWSQDALGARVGYSGTMIGYFEKAKRAAPAEFVAQAAEQFGAEGERLVSLWKEIDPRRTPAWFRQWPKIEARAQVIRTWEPLIVPGLLQTPDYARAVLRGSPGATEGRVDELLAGRLQRQAIFDRPEPPIFSAVLDEGVLLRPIGGPAAMREQLARLLEVADNPRITVQVVPLDTGVTTGLLGGFAIAQLPDGHGWAYLESASQGQVTDRIDEVQGISLRYDTIRAWAHPLHVSKTVISEAIARYER